MSKGFKKKLFLLLFLLSFDSVIPYDYSNESLFIVSSFFPLNQNKELFSTPISIKIIEFP